MMGWAGGSGSIFDTLEANDFNGVLWADDIDDLDTKLGNLPSAGGHVALRGGSYTDADISSSVTIPTDRDFIKIDLSLADLTLTSFNPSDAYFQRGNQAGQSYPLRPIEFIGFNKFDVQGLTNPPSYCEFWDIENSHVYIPWATGGFEYVVESHSDTGSGHMNRFYAKAFQARSGYKVETHSVSNDRSFYYGQFNRLTNFGVNVTGTGGQNNHFYAQPENELSGESATGYKLGPDAEANHIWITHIGPSTPLDIEGERNVIHYPLGNGPGADTLLNSNPGVKPTNWRDSLYRTNQFNFSVDWLGAGVLESNGDGSPSLNNFGLLLVPAGGSDGNSTQVRTPSRIGNIASGYLLYFYFKLNTTTNADYKIGVGTDNAGGDSEFIGLEADDANSNWSVVVQDGGGAREVDTELTAGNSESGSAIGQDTSKHEAVMMVVDDRQSFFWDWEHVFTASQSVTFGNPVRAFVEAVNDGGTSAQIDVHELQYMGQE